MPKLTDKVKLFIVQQNACYDSPSQVAEAVKEEFDVIVDKRQIQHYDPTKITGKDCSKKHRAIFAATRKAFLEKIEDIPIAQQSFRLRSLQRMHDKAVKSQNSVLAAQLLEQVAKEVGGAFTDRRRIGNIPGEGPFKTETAEILSDDALEKIARGNSA